MEQSPELVEAMRRSAEAWEQLSDAEKNAVLAQQQFTGFSLQGASQGQSPLVLPPTGIALPEGIVVPEGIRALEAAREQEKATRLFEQMAREQRPMEPVIVAGAPKPSRTGTLSQRAASLKNTARGSKMNRRDRRREAKKRYG